MSTAVVILNYNGEALLREFLPHVVEHSSIPGVVVVVADNASTDGSVEYVSTTFPTVQIIALAENYGFAEGYNRALAAIDSDYYVLLNNDVLVPDGWLTPLVEYLEEHPSVAAVQPKILKYSNGEKTQQFEYAGAAGGYLDRDGYPFCRGRLMAHVEEDRGQYDTPCEIDWATGACLVIRRDSYRQQGGMDKHFFAHQEEIDLCWRLRLAGEQIMCVPQSRVWHKGGGTLDNADPRKTFLNYRNNLAMLCKNMAQERVMSVLRRRRLCDMLTALSFLLRGKRPHAAAIIRAYRTLHTWQPYLHEQRATIQRSRRRPASRDTQPLSLPYHYYLLRRRHFRSLPL